MPHITIEYMILIPLLLLQVFLYPLAASWIMNIWVDSRRELALRDIASNLGSSIQQLYLSLTTEDITAGTIVYVPDVPKFVEGCSYQAIGYLYWATNTSKVLEIRVTLKTYGNTARMSVILGPDFVWLDSIFISNSTDASIIATKNPNGTLMFMFRS